jgi:hypothetical protein
VERIKAGFNKAIKCFRDDYSEFVNFMDRLKATVVRVIPYGTSFLQAALENLHFGAELYRDPRSGQLQRLSLPPITDAASLQAVCLAVYRDVETDNWRNKASHVLEAIDKEAELRVRDRRLRCALDRQFHDAAPNFAVWTATHIVADFLNGDVPAYYHKLSSRKLLSSSGSVVQVSFGVPDGIGEVLELRRVFGWAASPSPFFHRPSVKVVIELLERLGTDGFFFSDYLGACTEELDSSSTGLQA